MITSIHHKATKTRSSRPGWSVTFSHPRRSDARGKFGLKVRRGLGTRDDTEADRLIEQLNQILADESLWSLDRRTDAAQRFDSVVVNAFYEGIEVGKFKSRDIREKIIPLSTPDDGYARIMLVGSTGAGKTTLLRQLIGSDPRRDRFPSTSTAKTTTADIEIITGSNHYEAVITFMTEHEVRCSVDECLEEACASVIRGRDDTGIANDLLEHREQRFRLSYPLGAWQQELLDKDTGDQYEMDYEDEEPETTETLTEDEVVNEIELSDNLARLQEYVERIKKVATAVREQTMKDIGDFQDLDNANQRQDWLEHFTDKLYDNQDFPRLSNDIMDAIQDRFSFIDSGDFERSATGWPIFWYYDDNDRTSFLKQVRWFSSNHDKQFGRLLTPLVDGIRVRGPFQPNAPQLIDEDRRLVLLDGEGLGHSAKEANSISTKVTEKFPEVDMILLVDNAQSPMQAAPLELLRSVGSSGHGHKLAVAFTHFDQVKGDNLSNYSQKRSHVRASMGNAISSLRESLGAPVTEILERRLYANDFYLGGLDRQTQRIPQGFIKDIGGLMVCMQKSAEPLESIEPAPTYNIARLELALRDAADGFKNPWFGRLGLSYYDGIRKEHWTRVKALCRRIASWWDNEYNGLRPVSDLIRQLQTSISLWLDRPASWTSTQVDEDEKQVVINSIRQKVFIRIHDMCERRLIDTQRVGWGTAFGFSGRGSSVDRAQRMARIYDEAAPSISSVGVNTISTQQEFLDEIIEIIREAVEEEGGSVVGTN